jgi:hypothetical protein
MVNYKHVLIEFDSDHSHLVCWIPEEFAHDQKRIIIGKDKGPGARAKVICVFSIKGHPENRVKHKDKFSYLLEYKEV